MLDFLITLTFLSIRMKNLKSDMDVKLLIAAIPNNVKMKPVARHIPAPISQPYLKLKVKNEIIEMKLRL